VTAHALHGCIQCPVEANTPYRAMKLSSLGNAQAFGQRV